MSGIFGIFRTDGKPVQQSYIKKLLLTMSHRGPDCLNVFTDKNIGFGHCMLHTTPESLTEEQPYSNHRKDLIITADARIDNRTDLFSQIGVAEPERANISDSQLILLAYDKWGIDSFTKFIGDFAFAIWDCRNKRLLCVRDFLGIKPMYYYKSPDTFIFCSEIKPIIVAFPKLKNKVNESLVIEYLSLSFCSQNATLYYDIHQISPGYSHTISKDSFFSKKYYFFKRKRILYKHDNDYTDHFMEVFSQAVTQMLRSNTTIGVELSGGLDSSSICGMASTLTKNATTKQLLAYSQIFPGFACDESSYIQSMLNTSGVKSKLIESGPFSPPDYDTFVNTTFTLPEPPNLSLFNPLKNAVRADGTRVLLSGNGGDQWFQGCNFIFLDVIRSLDLPMLYSEIYSPNKKLLLKNIRNLSINILWPNIPKQFRARIRRKRYQHGFPPWLKKSFIKRTRLLKHIEKTDAYIDYPDLAFATVFQLLIDGYENYFLGILNQNSARYSFEYRFPFFYRPLVEFALNIPEYQRKRNQQTKHILRQAGKTLLPELIRNRQDKAEFTLVLPNTFGNKTFGRTINNMANQKNNWIDSNILQKHYTASLRALKNGAQLPQHSWKLWFAFAIGIWYDTCIRKEE